MSNCLFNVISFDASSLFCFLPLLFLYLAEDVSCPVKPEKISKILAMTYSFPQHGIPFGRTLSEITGSPEGLKHEIWGASILFCINITFILLHEEKC